MSSRTDYFFKYQLRSLWPWFSDFGVSVSETLSLGLGTPDGPGVLVLVLNKWVLTTSLHIICKLNLYIDVLIYNLNIVDCLFRVLDVVLHCIRVHCIDSVFRR